MKWWAPISGAMVELFPVSNSMKIRRNERRTVPENLHNFGYHLNVKKSVRRIISRRHRGGKGRNLIETLMLRSMKKALFSGTEIHPGLATKFYSLHGADSPVSGLAIQIPKKYLGKLKGDDTKTYGKGWIDRGAHVTTERRAEAEREVDDMKKAEYMSQFIGDD